VSEALTQARKRLIDIKYSLTTNPAKNYIFNLLQHDIAAADPARSLDAGAGELRNFWMFPGQYFGISHRKATFLRGLQYEVNAEIIAERGMPHVYLQRLESDFSYLGAFDLVACTFTLEYVQDRLSAALRLSDRVSRGGTCLLEGELKDGGARIVEAIAPLYDRVHVTYWGTPATNRLLENFSDPAFVPLTQQELRTANVPEGHDRFYISAFGKKADPGAAGPRPEIIADSGLFIVKSEIPYLRLAD
jgi:hypothetical protein